MDRFYDDDWRHCAHCGEEFLGNNPYRLCIRCHEGRPIDVELLIESFVRHNYQRLGFGDRVLPLFTFRHVCREIRAEFDRAWEISQVYRSSVVLPSTHGPCRDVVD